jgi:hypothetical protein
VTPTSTLQSIPLDERIPAAKIAEELRIHPATVRRWCLGGIRGGIRLRSVQIGGRRYVDRRDVREFLAACAAATGESPAVAPCSAPAES